MTNTKNAKFESILASEQRVRVAQTVAQFGESSQTRVRGAVDAVKFRRELLEMLDTLSTSEMIEYGKYRS